MWLWRLGATTFAIWIATLFPLDLVVHGGNGSWWGRLLTFLVIGLVLMLVNALVKPVVKIVTLPLRLLTLGLFSFVINWAMLALTAWISSGLNFATIEVGGFWKTLLAALIISVVAFLLGGSRSAQHE